MNILLIGARASGKTTIGEAVAKKLGRTFIDLDSIALAAFAQESVKQVWANHGEQAWRNAEADALDKVLTADNQIVALGGGTPMITRARNRIDHDRQAGRVRCIYLRCDATELARRLQMVEGDRPSLTGLHPADEIASVVKEREATYRAIADNVLDVTRMSPAKATSTLGELIAAF